MSKHIFWIASYPKSGNTLIRSILISLFFTNDGVFNLKMLKKIPQFESVNFIFKNSKLFNGNFTKLHNIEIFYRYISHMQEKKILNFNEDFKFFKTHSGNFKLGNHCFTDEKNIRGIVYIVRDPRDVCISWARHLNVSIEKCINVMSNDTQAILWRDNNDRLLKEKTPSSLLSSWDKHIISWTSTKWKVPIILLKFEDLINNKEKEIKKLIDFFTNNYGFSFNNLDKKLPQILKTTNFAYLQKDEENNGFIEAVRGEKFFYSGKQNHWKINLTKEQVRKIEYKFKKIMNRFNYQISS